MFLKIIHIILAFSVFVSTTGVSIPKDFCMAKFIKSIVHSVKGKYGSQKHATKPLASTDKTNCGLKDLTGISCSKTTNNCPLKVLNIAQSDQDYNTVSNNFTLKKVDIQCFTFNNIIRFVAIDSTPSAKLLTYLNYRPPPLERDIVVLCQNFRC